jgi:hypothetical protein
MKRLFVLLFALTACGGSATTSTQPPTSPFIGTYRLASYAGLSVPTARYAVSCNWRGANIAGSACSDTVRLCCFMQDVAAGQLTLKADGTYSLVVTQGDGTPVPEMTFLTPGIGLGTWGDNDTNIFLLPAGQFCCIGGVVAADPEWDAFVVAGLTPSQIPLEGFGPYESMTFVR